MNEAFDTERFEQLSGMQLGVYAVEIAKSGNLPPDCLDYVRRNARRWDGQHLEMGLLFLSKIDSDEARHEIIGHLGHPLKHIRLTVLAFLDGTNAFDTHMLSKIKERLSSVSDDFEKHWINRIHEKATSRIQTRAK